MWSSSLTFLPLLLSQGGGGEGGRTPLGSLQGRDPATLRIQGGGGGWVSASEGRGCRLRCRLPRTPFSLLGSRSLSVAVERGLALQAEGMRRGSRVLLATSRTVSSASYATQPEGTCTHTHAHARTRTHARASICVCALTSRHTHGPSLQVYTHHTHSHTSLWVPAWLLPLAFPGPSYGRHVLQRNVNVQLGPVNQPGPEREAGGLTPSSVPPAQL